MEHKKIRNFLLVYYVIVLIISLLSLISLVRGSITIEEATNLLTTRLAKIIIGVPFLILLLAIISFVLTIKNKLSRAFLIHPVYYILFFVVWLNLIPIIISVAYHADVSPGILTNLSRFDIVFYSFEVLSCGFVLYKMIKKKI